MDDLLCQLCHEHPVRGYQIAQAGHQVAVCVHCAAPSQGFLPEQADPTYTRLKLYIIRPSNGNPDDRNAGTRRFLFPVKIEEAEREALMAMTGEPSGTTIEAWTELDWHKGPGSPVWSITARRDGGNDEWGALPVAPRGTETP